MEARTTSSAALAAALGFFALVAAAPARADDCAGRDGDPVKLVVQVTDVRSSQGEVAVTLYPSDPSRFLAPHGKLLRQRVKAAPTVQACFTLPRADTYAVAVYHDVNADHDFNRNALGKPTEGFGFSNDAPSKFGVPSFDAARFTIKGDASIRVRMRYLR